MTIGLLGPGASLLSESIRCVRHVVPLGRVREIGATCSILIVSPDLIPYLDTRRSLSAFDAFGGRVLLPVPAARLAEVRRFAVARGIDAIRAESLSRVVAETLEYRPLPRLSVDRWVACEGLRPSGIDLAVLRAVPRLERLGVADWRRAARQSRHHLRLFTERVFGASPRTTLLRYRVYSAEWLATEGFAAEVIATSLSYSCRAPLGRARRSVARRSVARRSVARRDGGAPATSGDGRVESVPPDGLTNSRECP